MRWTVPSACAVAMARPLGDTCTDQMWPMLDQISAGWNCSVSAASRMLETTYSDRPYATMGAALPTGQCTACGRSSDTGQKKGHVNEM